MSSVDDCGQDSDCGLSGVQNVADCSRMYNQDSPRRRWTDRARDG